MVFKAVPTCHVNVFRSFSKVNVLNLLLQPNLRMFCIHKYFALGVLMHPLITRTNCELTVSSFLCRGAYPWKWQVVVHGEHLEKGLSAPGFGNFWVFKGLQGTHRSCIVLFPTQGRIYCAESLCVCLVYAYALNDGDSNHLPRQSTRVLTGNII